jgi:hypothetical protein
VIYELISCNGVFLLVFLGWLHKVAGDTESVNHCKIEAEKAAAAAKQAAAKVAQASEQAAAALQSANDIAQGNPPDPPSKAGKVGKAALPVLKAPPTKTGRDAPNTMVVVLVSLIHTCNFTSELKTLETQVFLSSMKHVLMIFAAATQID